MNFQSLHCVPQDRRLAGLTLEDLSKFPLITYSSDFTGQCSTILDADVIMPGTNEV